VTILISIGNMQYFKCRAEWFCDYCNSRHQKRNFHL